MLGDCWSFTEKEQNSIDSPKKSDSEADLWIDCFTGVDSEHFITIFIVLRLWCCCSADSYRGSEIERVNLMSRSHTRLIGLTQVVRDPMDSSSSDSKSCWYLTLLVVIWFMIPISLAYFSQDWEASGIGSNLFIVGNCFCVKEVEEIRAECYRESVSYSVHWSLSFELP